jgi:hypothetical protein
MAPFTALFTLGNLAIAFSRESCSLAGTGGFQSWMNAPDIRLAPIARARLAGRMAKKREPIDDLIDALGTILVQALIERGLRLVMKRERIKELRIYPEQRSCKRPITEQILRLFSLADRQTLLRDAKPVQSFPPQFTQIQIQTVNLLGVPVHAFLG